MQLISHLLLCLLVLYLGQQASQAATGSSTKSDSSDYSDDDYIDEDENEVSKQTRQRNQSRYERVGTFYSWDRWEKWSKCATTCVQIKQRKCIERTKNSTQAATVERRFYPGNGQTGCSGVLKRYRQCKEERCKSGKHRLRDELCERLNSVPYRDTFHNWIGYEKEHDECMSFCRAVNSDLFISMNQSVIDGTPCNRPAVFYTHFYRRQAVCVEGICRAVHTLGLIRPVTTRDSQVKCGSVLCKHVSKLFNETNPTNSSYNHITTIPVGAMNLSVKQNIKTNNSLALKSADEVFLIGRDRLRIFSFNENEYEYNQVNAQLTSKGPLAKSVILLHHSAYRNQSAFNDIQYNYTIPISSSSVNEDEELQAVWDASGKLLNDTEDSYGQKIRERKRRRYSWKLLGFGPCNRSCGPGTQTPIFRCVCVRESNVRYYSPRRCAHLEKPTFDDVIYNCNRGLCPAFWRPSNFSKCECPAGNSVGQRKRLFECMQEQIKGNVESVPEEMCPVRAEQPSQSCQCSTEN